LLSELSGGIHKSFAIETKAVEFCEVNDSGGLPAFSAGGGSTFSRGMNEQNRPAFICKKLLILFGYKSIKKKV